jgi:hypothetical protein
LPNPQPVELVADELIRADIAGQVAYADYLGNVSAWTNFSGGFVSGSLARYEPFGGYRT